MMADIHRIGNIQILVFSDLFIWRKLYKLCICIDSTSVQLQLPKNPTNISQRIIPPSSQSCNICLWFGRAEFESLIFSATGWKDYYIGKIFFSEV